jgi:hypothetical protein
VRIDDRRALVLPMIRTDTAAGKCGVKDQVSTRSPLEVISSTGRVVTT